MAGCPTCTGGGGADKNLSTELTKRFGVRPRNYRDAFDCSNESKKEFAALLPKITKEVNDKIKANGYHFSVTQAELGTNVLIEGLYLSLKDNHTKQLDGFYDLGIDTLVDNKAALKPWLTDPLNKRLASGTGISSNTNEKNENTRSLKDLSLEDGMAANAAMYAYSKALVSKDLAAKGIDLAKESESRQMFWTTAYFNAGPGGGKKLLDANGIGFADKAWTKPDDNKTYWNSVDYNALMRTSTFNFLAPIVDPPCDPPKP